jgi:hypothetical protein
LDDVPVKPKKKVVPNEPVAAVPQMPVVDHQFPVLTGDPDALAELYRVAQEAQARFLGLEVQTAQARAEWNEARQKLSGFLAQSGLEAR